MPLSSLAAAALLAAAVPAPVSQVTVYSDRARVVRVAHVQLDGDAQVELPLLDDSVDASTIQLEAVGADVQRIDIAHVDEQDFPRGEARELLTALEKIDDKIAAANADNEARKKALDSLARIAPQYRDEPLKPTPKLDARGWTASIDFIAGEQAKLQDAVRGSAEALHALHVERQKLAVRASQIGGARRRTGHRVTASLSGSGKATLRLTYRVSNARWTPSYDVQFNADRGEAQVSFSALVSQESGEDWDDASLTLSTAVPSTSTVFPKLLSWKIGERERFIPTPAPQALAPIPAAPAPAPRVSLEEDSDEALRAKLAQVAQRGQAAPEPVSEEDSAEGGVEGGVVGGALSGAATAQKPAPPRSIARRRSRSKKAPMQSADAAPALEAPPSLDMPVAAAPPSPPPPSTGVPYGQNARSFEAVAPAMQAMQAAQGGVALAPPPAYVPPTYDANLPASLAGGYDLSFDSARKESIKSGEGARRVPLFTESWPVSAERVLYPALAPEAAFLVAQIKNAGDRILPGGPASLAVGADPAGTAQLKLVSAGETFTLPLGLDRAIKPIRNVNVVTEEKGFIGKDELTHYTVTIELANPYKKAIPVRVIDQMPLPANKEAQLELEKIDPQPKEHEKDTGKLEWALELPASGKRVVTFTYSLRRPKGYRLYQEQ